VDVGEEINEPARTQHIQGRENLREYRWDLRNTEYEKLSITILHDTSYQVLQGEVL